MAYYYDPNGNKVPVDDHSPPEARQAAFLQQQKDAAANQTPAQRASSFTNFGGMGMTADQQAAQQAANQALWQQQGYNAHWQYGGNAGGAANAAGTYGGLAQAAENRGGILANMDGANNAYNQGQLSRDRQNDVAYGLLQRANGQVPSIAQMQANRQMGQAAAEQSSAAASARGPAGLALAQQGAAANTAAMQSNISGQAQINAANERLQAQQAAFGAYSGMRSGDAALQAQMAQQGQYQAGLDMQQRGLNDARSQAMYGNQIAVNTAQLQAQGNQMAAQMGQQQAQAQLGQNAQFHSDDQTAKYIGYGLGAAGTAAGVAAAAGLFGGPTKSAAPAPGSTAPTGNINTGLGSSDMSSKGLAAGDPYSQDPNNWGYG